MTKNTQTFVIRGKTSFAKILGDPVPNYEKTGKEWKMDLKIDKSVEKEMKAAGLGDRVKRKDGYLGGEPFMTFKQKELKADGTPAQAPTVQDIKGNPWDQNKLIGNDSTVDVKFIKMDHGAGKKAGVYIRAVRVLDLNEYNRQEFDAVNEDDEFFNAVQEAEAAEADRKKREDAQFKKDFNQETDEDLDDDLPM